MSELISIGGIVPLMKMLLAESLLHGDCLTVTGKTLKQNLAPFKPYPKGQEIVRSIKNPIKKTVISSFSKAISLQRGQSPRSAARKARSSAARPASSSPRRRLLKPSWPIKSRRVM
jgi:hypothetical protein